MEKAYCGWIRRFIVHHGKRHPREMGAPEVEAFLTDLARRRGVAASTQNQALAALLFLDREAKWGARQRGRDARRSSGGRCDR